MAARKASRVMIWRPTPLRIFIVLFVVTLFLASYVTWRQTTRLDDYRRLAATPNQACLGLSHGAINNKPVNLSAQFRIEGRNSAGRTVTYTCLIDTKIAAATIQGKRIGSYELGAYALYFKSHQAALNYAEHQVNPLRYWGVDAAGQAAGIPQTASFTFIVSNARQPYYDAYTVKNDAVVRISLPCGDPDVKTGGVSCYAEAQSSLQSFADAIAAVNL